VVEIGWAEWPGAVDWVARHASLLVLGGGGYFYAHAGGKLAGRVARDAASFTRLRCPVVSLAPGVNRLLSDAAARWDADSATTLGALLDRLALSSARDAASVALLEQARPGRTRLLADPALFLAAAGPPAPRAAGRLTIGLNLAFHGPASSRALPGRLALLIGACQRLMRREQCQFTYFVHSEAERALPPLLRAAGLPVQTVDAPAEAMLPHYAALDLHICQMLHSSILAANAGTPFVALGYDMKNAAFAELMGVSRYCLPADATAPAGLDAAIDAALAGRALLAGMLAARKLALRAEMDAYLAELAQYAG
jgi:polysaccharide pyruvyl transferase WcaK-like protein